MARKELARDRKKEGSSAKSHLRDVPARGVQSWDKQPCRELRERKKIRRNPEIFILRGNVGRGGESATPLADWRRRSPFSDQEKRSQTKGKVGNRRSVGFGSMPGKFFRRYRVRGKRTQGSSGVTGPFECTEKGGEKTKQLDEGEIHGWAGESKGFIKLGKEGEARPLAPSNARS